MGYKYELQRWNWESCIYEEVCSTNTLIKLLWEAFKAKRTYPCLQIIWR